MTPQIDPKIIFEDTHLIVLSKPAGLLSQGERQGEPNLVDWLRGHFGRYYVGLVHRLDRNTSGIMVAAKRTKAARRLTEALREGELTRIYLAWLIGDLKHEARWRHWLVKDTKKNKAMIVSANNPKAKEAILSVKPVGHGEWRGKTLTLAEFKLETGRAHQIRVQSACEGFPLLGDCKYGNNAVNTISSVFGRPALHSHKIFFPHPMTGKTLSFEDPLPEDMAQIKVVRR